MNLAIEESLEDRHQVTVGLAQPYQRVAVDVPGTIDVTRGIDDPPVLLPAKATLWHVSPDRPEQILGHRVKANPDDVRARIFERLQPGFVESRRCDKKR